MNRKDLSFKQMSYPGGLTWLRRRSSRRKEPFIDVEKEILRHTDFELLKGKKVVHRPVPPGLPLRHILAKVDDLTKTFEDDCALCYNHALTIAILRHDNPPPIVADTFHAMWDQEGDYLIDALDFRWLVSAMITFADHGRTPEQRIIANAISTLVNTMKLYETERLFSGMEPTVPFKWVNRLKESLFLDLYPYYMKGGDLDRNLLQSVWELADQADEVLKPLAMTLVEAINRDPRTIFRRMRKMREKLARQKLDARKDQKS